MGDFSRSEDKERFFEEKHEKDVSVQKDFTQEFDGQKDLEREQKDYFKGDFDNKKDRDTFDEEREEREDKFSKSSSEAEELDLFEERENKEGELSQFGFENVEFDREGLKSEEEFKGDEDEKDCDKKKGRGRGRGKKGGKHGKRDRENAEGFKFSEDESNEGSKFQTLLLVAGASLGACFIIAYMVYVCKNSKKPEVNSTDKKLDFDNEFVEVKVHFESKEDVMADVTFEGTTHTTLGKLEGENSNSVLVE